MKYYSDTGKTIKIKFLLILVILFIFQSFSYTPIPHLGDDNFSFTISMADSVFLEGQPIHVILKIKNLRMVKDSIGDIWEEKDIWVKDESTGKKLPPRIFVDFFSIPYLHFKKGEEKTLDFEIKQEFSSMHLVSGTNKYGATYHDNYYIPAGKYSVIISKWGIKSNQLLFEIVKPEEQDLNELNELDSALSKLDEHYRINNLYNFLTKYPDSKYYESALFDYTAAMLMNAYTSNDWINLITVTDKWFKKDTESEFAKGLIRDLGSVHKTKFTDAKKKIKEYLNKIVNDYPGTVISRWSAEYLKLFKDE